MCGLDGALCRPFHDQEFAFRCPADCRGTIISSPETIGEREYNYRNLVIGGSKSKERPDQPIYRGDSFICGAAIHAGVSRNFLGGGGVVSLTGEQNDFGAIDAHGISSINFFPAFPQSFTFLHNAKFPSSSCSDPRWALFFITAILTAMVSLLTTSPSLFFGTVFVITYFTVALATDPPDFENYMAVVSSACRGFLPAAFVAVILYQFCVRYTLRNLHAQFEKTFLWLGGCWLGSLNNFTFDKLPIQRLTPHDLRQPGAILTLLIIVFGILFITVFQALAFRIEGRMPRYLAFYAWIGLMLLTLISIPGMNLRIHHYILALLLLPGTTLQTRPSLLYQGLLIGLFINGIARWGFDSILQTPGQLFQGNYDSLIPQVAPPIIHSNNNSITFSWTNNQSQYDSMSIVVNDVERFRGSEEDNPSTFTWTRYKEDEPQYFRFAYVKHEVLKRSFVGRFSKPGTWQVNGTWTPPLLQENG